MRKPNRATRAQSTAKRTARRRRRVERRGTRRGRLPRPEVRADDPALTRFAGLIPLILFMTEALGIPALLKKVVNYRGRRRVHAPHLVLFAFVVAALAGVERLAHLDWLRDDVALVKYLRFAYWPVRKVFSAALSTVTERGVRLLEAFVGEMGLATVKGASSAIIDSRVTVEMSWEGGNVRMKGLIARSGEGGCSVSLQPTDDDAAVLRNLVRLQMLHALGRRN